MGADGDANAGKGDVEVDVGLKEAEGGVSKLATEFSWALNSGLETMVSSNTPTSSPGELR